MENQKNSSNIVAIVIGLLVGIAIGYGASFITADLGQGNIGVKTPTTTEKKETKDASTTGSESLAGSACTLNNCDIMNKLDQMNTRLFTIEQHVKTIELPSLSECQNDPNPSAYCLDQLEREAEIQEEISSAQAAAEIEDAEQEFNDTVSDVAVCIELAKTNPNETRTDEVLTIDCINQEFNLDLSVSDSCVDQILSETMNIATIVNYCSE